VTPANLPRLPQIPERFRRRRPGLYRQAKAAVANVNRITSQISDPAFFPLLASLVVALVVALLGALAIIAALVAAEE
jgi:hypothetical protein